MPTKQDINSFLKSNYVGMHKHNSNAILKDLVSTMRMSRGFTPMHLDPLMLALLNKPRVLTLERSFWESESVPLGMVAPSTVVPTPAAAPPSFFSSLGAQTRSLHKCHESICKLQHTKLQGSSYSLKLTEVMMTVVSAMACPYYLCHCALQDVQIVAWTDQPRYVAKTNWITNDPHYILQVPKLIAKSNKDSFFSF